MTKSVKWTIAILVTLAVVGAAYWFWFRKPKKNAAGEEKNPKPANPTTVVQTTE